MIEIKEGSEFEEQSQQASEHISQLMNPRNEYIRTQENILRWINNDD